MTYELVRLCPQCAGEFRPEVESCPDCDCGLEYRELGGGGPALEPQAPSVLAKDVPTISLGFEELHHIKRLASRLHEAGIPCRVGETDLRDRFTVQVAESEAEDARRIHAEYTREIAPHVEHSGELSTDRCPACGNPLPEEAAECRDCGLLFPEAEA